MEGTSIIICWFYTRIISVEYLIFMFETTKNLKEAEAFSFTINSRLRYRRNLITVQSAHEDRQSCASTVLWYRCVRYCEKSPLLRSPRFYKPPEKDRRRSFISLRRVPNRATDNIVWLDFTIQLKCLSFANLAIIIRHEESVLFSWHLTIALLSNVNSFFNSFQCRDILIHIDRKSVV